MIPELGHLALILAMATALGLAVVPLIGAARGQTTLMHFAHRAALVHATLVFAAFAALGYAFWANDFSVKYVASHSNSALPVAYRLAAVWGGHEGSMLLWLLMLALWTLAVSVFSRGLPQVLVARALAVMGMVAICFESFILFTSNPFSRLIPAAADGRDLNPLLQDPGMVLHPPMLYMGYVGFSVAFALAVSALLSGRMDAAWARWCRPWTIAAWASLTGGIALGSWWAYTELGWGGWWFWDPVENASFLPWLTGTALIHSLAVTEKRGQFKSWTALLAISSFALSLLGTFLVRSGVLTSVHAFATDPKRGVFILGLLVLVVGGSFLLFAWRAGRFAAPGTVAKGSREFWLLTNNALLCVATATVLLGTLYPLALDALGQGKISVGPPYFDAVFAPVGLALAMLLGFGAWSRWGEAMDVAKLRSLAPAAAGAIAAGALFAGAVRPFSWLGTLAVAVAGWLAMATLWHVVRRLRGSGSERWTTRLARQGGSYFGMQLAHLGVAVFIVGVACVKSAETTRDVPLQIGQAADVAGYQFRLRTLEDVQGPNYQAVRATIDVALPSGTQIVLAPEKRVYRVQTMPMTEAAIDSGLLRDVYVSMGEAISQSAWIFRVQVKPFVNWIWGGCVLMALGGLLAFADRRYRLVFRTGISAQPSAAVPAAAE
ncbi:MAG TPA: heme lyase CcmF/NrfE family subunit [Usitatibacteraceae bacterium]|nr:heme lyase CcmF/NrfE family subunit [Usitatibacteraceae bacterium]